MAGKHQQRSPLFRHVVGTRDGCRCLHRTGRAFQAWSSGSRHCSPCNPPSPTMLAMSSARLLSCDVAIMLVSIGLLLLGPVWSADASSSLLGSTPFLSPFPLPFASSLTPTTAPSAALPSAPPLRTPSAVGDIVTDPVGTRVCRVGLPGPFAGWQVLRRST